MFTVICYDIGNDGRRLAAASRLKRCCRRVQRSVFEGELSERELTALMRSLGDLIEPGEDSVRCYRLDAAAVERIRVLGAGEVSREASFYVVGG